MASFMAEMSLNREEAHHPVNLVFRGNAPASRVASILLGEAVAEWYPPERWRRFPNNVLNRVFGYVDDTDNGGQSGWRLPAEGLVLGPPVLGTRFHIRIVQGSSGDRPDSDFGWWCIANVHREQWVPYDPAGQGGPGWHIITGWREPQMFLAEFFARLNYATVSPRWMNNAGWYLGHYFDGIGTDVELA